MLRTLTLDNGDEVVDRLDALGVRSYTYSIVASKLPFRAYEATMSVEPLGRRSSELVWSGNFEPDGIGDDEAIEFATSMYRFGVRLISVALAELG